MTSADVHANIDKYLASYSGMDGGNLSAPVWICGIEHGGDVADADDPLPPELAPNSWTAQFKVDYTKFTTWQYHQKVAKLMVALSALKASGGEPDLKGWNQYLKDDLYSADGDTFKLNLYPLPCPSVSDPSWATKYKDHPLLRDKSTYYAKCAEVRFRFMSELRRANRPDVIIGTGISFDRQFRQAFGFGDVAMSEGRIAVGQQSRRFYQGKSDGTTLIVVPFFGGRYGLNSDALIQELAKVVSPMIRPLMPHALQF